MPAKSKKQYDLMRAVANNPKFAKKTGIPQSVGEEYMKAGKKYQMGGMADSGDMPMRRSRRRRDEMRDEEMRSEEMPMGMKKGGKAKKMAKGGMSSCGTKKKMAKGGKVRGCGIAKKGVRKAKMY